MGLRYTWIIFVLSIVLFFTSNACLAQVRIIQWTDVHASLPTISKQLAAIDQQAQDFLQGNPKGEVIIYVIGDFTSINSYNSEEGGWSSLEALHVLRQRGYTVLFTPGNHDAFDWTVKIDGAQLFLQQMQQLKKWGVVLLAQNFVGMGKTLRSLLRSSYPMKGVEGNSHIVGFTLPGLLNQSNLNEETARPLFKKIANLQESFERVLIGLDAKGVDSVVFGIHKGHSKIAAQIPFIKSLKRSQGIKIKTSLLMGAHDHKVASYSIRGTVVADAGAYGSFNVIDLDSRGNVIESALTHIAISESALAEVDDRLFLLGDKRVNDTTEESMRDLPWLDFYRNRIDQQLQSTRTRLARSLVKTAGFVDHKMTLKQGRQDLGSVLSEALVEWVRPNPLLRNSNVPVIAMLNSSSYRVEEAIPAGDLTELQVRMMYPFHTEATLYKMRGSDIESLYFSLKAHFAKTDKTTYSPQMNFTVREGQGRLQVLQDGSWANLKRSQEYWLVLDAWLSEHRYGQSYRIPNWIKILKRERVLLAKPFQDILIENLPSTIHRYEENRSFGPRCANLFR